MTFMFCNWADVGPWLHVTPVETTSLKGRLYSPQKFKLQFKEFLLTPSTLQKEKKSQSNWHYFLRVWLNNTKIQNHENSK